MWARLWNYKWSIGGAVILILGGVWAAFLWNTDDPNRWGVFGDAFAPMALVVNALALLAAVEAVHLQRRELIENRQALKQQAEAADLTARTDLTLQWFDLRAASIGGGNPASHARRAIALMPSGVPEGTELIVADVLDAIHRGLDTGIRSAENEIGRADKAHERAKMVMKNALEAPMPDGSRRAEQHKKSISIARMELNRTSESCASLRRRIELNTSLAATLKREQAQLRVLPRPRDVSRAEPGFSEQAARVADH